MFVCIHTAAHQTPEPQMPDPPFQRISPTDEDYTDTHITSGFNSKGENLTSISLYIIDLESVCVCIDFKDKL